MTQAQAAVDKAKLDIKTTPVRSDIDAERLKLTLEEAESQLKMVQGDAAVRRHERAYGPPRVSDLTWTSPTCELKRAQVERRQVCS